MRREKDEKEGALIEVEKALGYEFPEEVSSYDARDVSLYGLGIGAARDPLDPNELRFVWEGHPGFAPFPTFGVVPAINVLLQRIMQKRAVPGLHYGLDRVLHIEQATELKRPLSSSATLIHRGRIKDIFDRSRNAVVVVSMSSFDESGQEIVYNEFTSLVRGAGGWGGNRGPAIESDSAYEKPPDAIQSERIEEHQALLYRLSGDLNPLHVDPRAAEEFGLSKPILHGLCSYAIAARHVLKTFGCNDPLAFKSIRARFAHMVYPGETLSTQMWRASEKRILFCCKAQERAKLAISNGVIELR